jgi:hypothetical protein
MNIPILVSIYVSSNNFLIIPDVKIEPTSVLQVLKESYFSLSIGETLLASSDDYNNFFNITVEGRLFTELSS